MPEVDFVMSYPCYFLLTANGNPETIMVGSDRCVCLFTDRHDVELFYKDKYGDNFAHREIEVMAFTGKQGLIETLQGMQDDLLANNMRHISVDFCPGKQIGYVEIDEFVRELEKQQDPADQIE